MAIERPTREGESIGSTGLSQEELECVLRARIREIKGWQQPAPTINEVMVCQARALIRELWPEEFDTKPDLRLIQGGRKS